MVIPSSDIAQEQKSWLGEHSKIVLPFARSAFQHTAWTTLAFVSSLYSELWSEAGSLCLAGEMNGLTPRRLDPQIRVSIFGPAQAVEQVPHYCDVRGKPAIWLSDGFDSTVDAGNPT